MNKITLESIIEAGYRLEGVAVHTPLEYNQVLSHLYGANIYLKREDLQLTRSYKIRGAYNLISTLSEEEKEKGVVTASAGNHSQAVAYSCDILGINGVIFMPKTTPAQKRQNTEKFGNGNVDVRLVGDDFDETYREAMAFSESNGNVFVHPFDDSRTIVGQGTIGAEIIQDFKENIDYLLAPIGGGGLISGIGTYFSHLSPKTKIIGVEPEEVPGMYNSLQAGKVITLDQFSHFIDGVAVGRVGDLTFSIAQQLGYKITLVPEGKVCTTMIGLYNNGIVAELAGALSVAALFNLKEEITGKNVVCILSGGNNDFDRLPEIKEKSLMYEGLKHYFIVDFPQRPGALRQFLDNTLGPNEDITRFEYNKKTAREHGPALVGIELAKKEDYGPLVQRFKEAGFKFEELNTNPTFLSYFI